MCCSTNSLARAARHEARISKHYAALTSSELVEVRELALDARLCAHCSRPKLRP